MSQPVNDAFKTIRDDINSRHAEAIRQIDAVEKLANTLNGGPSPAPATPETSEPEKAPEKKPAKKAATDGPTRRQMVLDAIKDWAGTGAIAKATGLTPKQIRVVLNAKDLATKIERRNDNGRTEFKLKA